MRQRKGLAAHEHAVECAQCGTPFTTTYAQAKYCSERCRQTYRNGLTSTAVRTAKAGRRCAHCGGEISVDKDSRAGFCSRRCAVASRNLFVKLATRADRPKARAFRASVAERDGWRCQLCGASVDRERTHPDPWSGSLDHIVPLARGGTNDFANLQLAHLGCNLSKGARRLALA
jgi:5-methylcytosine-specific restriction endonuclease McrA